MKRKMTGSMVTVLKTEMMDSEVFDIFEKKLFQVKFKTTTAVDKHIIN